jgi:hypothetical protein
MAIGCFAAATLSISPCFADQPAAVPQPHLTISDAALRSAPVGAASIGGRRPALQTTTSAPDGTAFFKTPKGTVVLALLGAGIGYGVYSKVHDRVHSPNPAR